MRVGTVSTGGEYDVVTWKHADCFIVPKNALAECDGDIATFVNTVDLAPNGVTLDIDEDILKEQLTTSFTNAKEHLATLKKAAVKRKAEGEDGSDKPQDGSPRAKMLKMEEHQKAEKKNKPKKGVKLELLEMDASIDPNGELLFCLFD